MSERYKNPVASEDVCEVEALSEAAQIIKELEYMLLSEADLSVEKSLNYLSILMEAYGKNGSSDIAEELRELELLIHDRFRVYSPASYITAFLAKIRRLEVSAVRLVISAEVSIQGIDKYLGPQD